MEGKSEAKEISMKRGVNDGGMMGLWCVIGWLVTVASVSAGTPAPQPAAKPKIERLRIAIAPLGYDTNFTWLEARSGHLDKRPALEYLIGIDRHSGAYIPELAAKWEMSPDGKSWTISLRTGVKFHDEWGEFTAKDVRHTVFLITQPESVQADAGTWRTLMGIGQVDTLEDVARRVAEGVESVDNYTVMFHLTSAAPEFLETLSTNTDLMLESKARWDAGGKELYGRKVVGHGSLRVRGAQGRLARPV
jgi:ABC-type transport system substrate-binding protein